MLNMITFYIAKQLCLYGFIYSLCNLASNYVFHLGFFLSPLLCLSYCILYLCTCCFLYSFRFVYLLGYIYCLFCIITIRMRSHVCFNAFFWLIDGFLGQPKYEFFTIFQLFIGFLFPPLSLYISGCIWIVFYQKQASRDFNFYVLQFKRRGVQIWRIRNP